jgi:toxin ParE1/3/4
MPSAYQLTDAAKQDYRKILRILIETFGLADLADEPHRQGARPFEKVTYFYHLRYSAKQAAVDGITVRKPRYFIVYRVQTSGILEIIRILYDAMDI